MKKIIIALLLFTVLCATAFAQKSGSTQGQETIVFLGASLTAGYSATVPNKDDYSKSPPAFFQKYVNIPVINVSKGDGRGTAKMLSVIKKEVLTQNPGIVVIGENIINDFRVHKLSPAASKNNLQKIIDMVNDGKRKIYLLRVISPDITPVVAVQYMDIFNTLASSNNIELIDGIMDGIGEDKFKDKFGHLNPAGYELMADNYFKVMAPYLKANNLLSDTGAAKAAEQTSTGIKYNWDFSNPSSGTAGWFVFPEGDWDYHGTTNVSRDDQTFGKGMLRVDIDYSKDSSSVWSEPKMKTVFNTPVKGATRITFDFIYSPALRKTGYFRTQVQIYNGTNLIAQEISKLISAVENLPNGYVKETISIWFNTSSPVDSIIFGISGIWTDYKGPVFFDNLRLE